MSGTETPQPAPNATQPAQDETVARETRPEGPSRSHSLLREIASGNALAGVLAVFLAVLVGSLMIALTDEEVRSAPAAYVFARPVTSSRPPGTQTLKMYAALFRGAVSRTGSTTSPRSVR